MKLAAPYNMSQVKTFRGAVDLYYWKGIPCAREWPRVSNQPNSAAQQAHKQRIRDMHTWVRAQPASYHTAAKTSGLTPTYSAMDIERRQGYRFVKLGHPAQVPDVDRIQVTAHPVLPKTTVILRQGAQTSPDSADWLFFARRRDTFPGWILWYESHIPCTRKHQIYRKWAPRLSGFIAPTSHSYNPAPDAWTMEFPFSADPILLLPVLDFPATLTTYAGAVYRSEDY